MAEKRKFYGMKNDYMFHAVLQKNEEVLRNKSAWSDTAWDSKKSVGNR